MNFNFYNVIEWRDKSGQGRIAKQISPSSQPEYIANELNNKSVLRFDNDRLSTKLTEWFETSNSGLTVFTLFKTTNNEGQKFLINHGSDQHLANSTNTNFELGYDTGLNNGSGNFGIHRGASKATVATGNTIENNTK